MDLDGIAIFVKVVQAGSFTRAGKLLGIPNSTLSRKVSLLEKRLGCNLLLRTTRKLTVTAAGEAYFKSCVEALEQIQSAESRLSVAQKAPKGVLRVTAPVELGRSLVAELCDAYMKKYPEVEVDIILSSRVVDLVAEGVDLAIRPGALTDPSLIVRKLAVISFGIWASSAYIKATGMPSRPSTLSTYSWVRFSPDMSAEIELSRGKETVRVKTPGRVSVDNFAGLKEMIVRGHGVGPLPDYLVQPEAAQRRIVRVLPDWLWRSGPLFIAYPAQRFVSPKIKAFIDVAISMRDGA